MSEITEVPPLSPSAELSEIRQAVALLIENGRAREPSSVGDPSQKFLTTQVAATLGLLSLGSGGTIIIGGPGTGGGGTDPGDPGDLSPPDPITGLAVTAGLSFFMVKFDAPTYTQGGGNGYTEIYAANYGGTGPLPTFSAAVMIGTVAGSGTIAVIAAEPAQTTHFWAGAVTANGVRQVDTIGPSGGTHGVSDTTGQDVSHLLDVLTGEITESQLYSTLGARINLIDGPIALPGSVNARVKTETDARTAADAAVASSVTTLSAQFAASGKNMLRNSSFELDNDSNGLADNWLQATLGTTGGAPTIDRTPGRLSGYAQRTTAAGLGTSTNDRHGFLASVPIVPGSTPDIMASAWVKGPTGTTARILINRYTAAGAFISATNADFALTGIWRRVNRGAALDATVGEVRMQITQVANLTGGAVAFEVDDAMVEPGTVLNDYTPGAGEWQVTFAAIQDEQTARATADEALATSVTLVQAQIGGIGTNSLSNSSFERDSDNDGLADEWTAGSSGTTGTNTRTMVAGRSGGYAQRVDCANLGNTDSDYSHFYQDVTIAVASGEKRTGSGYLRATAGTTLVLVLAQYQGATFVTQNVATLLATGVWQRLDVGATLSATTNTLRLLARVRHRATAGAAFLEVDDCQIEDGDTLHSYSTGPGEAQGLYAAVQTEAVARASTDGQLLAQYTVKVDVAGLVSGYGLASTATNGTPTSAFGVRANQFWVAPPSTASSTAPTANLYDGFVWLDTSVTPAETRYWRASSSTWVLTSPALPFIIQTTPTTINGVAVPAGVYMADAYIRNGSIGNVKIGNAAIDDAKIANVSAGKLTAGSIAVGEYVQSTGFVSGSQGFRVSGNGAAEFANATIRGIVYASGGAIGGAVIDTSGMRSGNYVFGASGWRLDNASGQIIAYAGRIGGAVITPTTLQSTNFNAVNLGWSLDNATGKIWAMSAVLGQWEVLATALRLYKPSYGSGTAGIWMGIDAGVPKIDIGNSASFMRWDGTNLLLSNPLLDTFSATINAGDGTVTVPGDSQNFKLVSLGGRSVSTVTGGRAPYTYQWLAVAQVASSAASSDYALSGGTTASCTLYAYGTGESHQKIFRLICLVTDANGRTTSVGATITANLSASDFG